jgi:serine/threonine protein kinase
MYTVDISNKEEHAPTFSTSVIAVIVSCVLLVVLMTALLLRLCWRDNYVRLLRTDEQNFLHGEKPIQVMGDAGTQTDIIQPSPYAIIAYNKDKYEVSESKLEKKEVIGEGQFGVVYRYIWKDAEGEREVACKTIKDPNDMEAFKLLLEEIKILQHVGNHPNVIRLLGAVTKDIRKLHAFIVVEYCHFGNLKKYLVDHRGSFHSEISERGNFLNNSSTQPIGNYVQLEYAMKTSNLIQWSYEIACGMDYLGEKRLIHRDLAARNVVLDSLRVAKITDFGLCKNLEKNTGPNAGKDYYRFNPGKKNPLLPLPWLAPEIVDGGVCSTYSDIWAYGVTLWEIFSLGEQPYPGKLTGEITKFLEDGNRMEKPPYCNTAIYNTMLDCWKQTPKERPKFSELKNTFANLQAQLKECESSSMCPSEGEENSDEEGNVDSDTMET